VCEDWNDDEKLYGYMALYREKGLPQYVFNALYESKRYHKLLTFPDDFSNDLTQFIAPFPHLSWIHFLRTKYFKNAAEALEVQSSIEQESVERKKVYLSLAKLSRIAHTPESTTSQEVRSIEEQLYLLKAQEGFLTELKTPLTPSDFLYTLIKHATTSNNWLLITLDAYLKTTLQIPAEKRADILRDIWTRAFRQEDWQYLSNEWQSGRFEETGLRNFVQNTTFYKVASLSANKGLLPKQMLESIISRYTEDHKNQPSLVRVLTQVHTILSATT